MTGGSREPPPGSPPPADPPEPEEGGAVEAAGKSAAYTRDTGTRQKLTYVIIGLLAATFLLHYVTLAWFIDPEKTARVTALQRVFDVWLPVISGLAGSAATYFYTRGGH